MRVVFPAFWAHLGCERAAGRFRSPSVERPFGTARLVELRRMQDTFAGLIEREKQLERYSRLEAGLPSSPACPARSIAGIGWLFDLLPRASHNRPVDPSGVVELHRCLAVLDSGAES